MAEVVLGLIFLRQRGDTSLHTSLCRPPIRTAYAYSRRNRHRVWPQVLFENHTLLRDNESLDPRRLIVGGIRHQSKCPSFPAAGSIAASACHGISTHDSKVVAMKGSGQVAIGIRCACADEALSKSRDRVFTVRFCVIFLRRVVFAL